MAFEFRFPDVGEGITEGEIVAWKVSVGDRVEVHQVLVEMETDKAVVEIPSPVAGTVLELRGAPGDVVRVGDVLVVIGEAGESAAKEPERVAAVKVPEGIPVPGGHVRSERQAPRTPVHRGSVGVVGELEEAPEDEEPREAAAEAEPPRPTVSAARVEALPRERQLAKELGVDLALVRGTGPRGRVTEADVRLAAERGAPEKGAPPAKPAPGADEHGPVERVALRGVRRKIAEAMVRSLSRAAQVTTTDEADVTLLAQIREKELRAAAAEGVKLTLLAFVVKAVVAALRKDPYLNASVDDGSGEVVLKAYYNIGVAVETRDGLIVPNVKGADQKTVLEVARDIQDLADRARKRTLSLSEVKGGTFTLSNYGAIGGLFATPILNDPEVGILGVGKVAERAVAKDGALRARKILPLSLTFDHRVVDGATAQHFLNNVVRHLEDPDLLFIGA